jgi:dipeptidyl aminopeptidase/acylaminoacyl peptidase
VASLVRVQVSDKKLQIGDALSVNEFPEEGIIDKTRVGTTGWSNGGTLSLTWITRTG